MGKVTVILADDDIQILDAFQKCFHHLADIHLACDGESTLELIKSGIRPAVLICDYRMPDMNGVDVVKRAREMMSTDFPAIIASGDTSAQTIAEANLARCTVLRKPYTPEALFKLIAHVNIDRIQDDEAKARQRPAE